MPGGDRSDARGDDGAGTPRGAAGGASPPRTTSPRFLGSVRQVPGASFSAYTRPSEESLAALPRRPAHPSGFSRSRPQVGDPMMNDAPRSRLRLKKDLDLRDENGKTLALDPTSGRVFLLNATGRMVLDALKSGTTRESLLESLETAYPDEDRDRLESDLHRVLLDFAREDLIDASHL
ncbi:MAG TPA: PqqD family protein [Planctomycetes bacterium]|nr:PqqD family protein [Planctomycetota bacterium]